ncbi:MAG: translocation/assembly module TamB [Muribaculaceae bacterium]|nr:translocation/assembly module TamB [Muribaculaceae bacterium]
MKVKTVLRRIAGSLLGVLLGLVLLLTGTLMLLYSPWAQGLILKAVNEKFGHSDGMSLSIESLRLSFPLNLALQGLKMEMEGGMNIAAESADLRVAVLPLLGGKADIERAVLIKGSYEMGGPDSALWLRIDADSLALDPARVALSTMDVDLENATIARGRMTLVMGTDTTPPTPPSPPTDMRFRLGKVHLLDFGYTMRMMPTIDTLSAYIPQATLQGGLVDLYNQHITLGTLTGRGLDARYIVPDSAMIAAFGPEPVPAPIPDSLAAAPWIIEIDTIGFDRSHALYTTAGYQPTPGLDFSYIEADSVSIGVRHFYNEETIVRAPLTFEGTERCGVRLLARGTLDIDSVALGLNSFSVTTPAGTDLAFTGLMGMGDLTTDPTLPVALDATAAFAPADLRLMFPAFLPYWAALPANEPVRLRADLKGTMGSLEIDTLGLALNRCVYLDASGRVDNAMNPDLLAGHVDLRGRIVNVDRIKNALLEPATAKSVNIPPMTLAGKVDMRRGGVIDGDLSARTGAGQLRLQALWNSKMESYDASVKATDFPVQAFMPLMGVSNLTATASANGKGYDPFALSTQLKASAAISSATYGGYTYTGISADASVENGHANIRLDSDNPGMLLTLTADGNLNGDVYRWHAELDGENIDLQTLKFSETPANVETRLSADAEIGPGMNNIRADLNLNDLFYRQTSGTIGLADVKARFTALVDSGVRLTLNNRDLNAEFTSPAQLDTLLAHFSEASTLLDKQIAERDFRIDTIQQALPKFKFTLTGSNSNLINDVLRPSDMGLQNITIKARNDSTLRLNGRILEFNYGSTMIDTIYIAGGMFRKHLHLLAGVGNRPGTLDALARVWLHASVDGNQARLNLQQRNIKGDVGFRLGFKGIMADSAVTVSVDPLKPIIGYQQWEANEGNFIEYFFPTGHLDANLHMQGGKSAIAVYTEESGEEHAEHSHEHQDDLIVKLTDIHIQDWIALNPFAPPMTGDVSADLRLNRSTGTLLGMGSMGISNFYYNRKKVEDIAASFNVAASTGGQINAFASLNIGGRKVMDLRGALNDSTSGSPLAMDLSLIRIPLDAANPFIPPTMGSLRGVLNGSMEVSGTADSPLLNGWMSFDSTAVTLAMTGTPYAFNDVKIPVEDSRMQFRGFTISGTNENPLTVNGSVDLRDLSNMGVNLNLKARNTQIINTNRLKRGADIYGKAFIDLDATAKGNMRFMAVDAALKILPGTNVTYVMPDATTEIANYSSGELVKFVNFNDSVALARADSIASPSMAMMLDASLTIEDGSTINVDLSSDGKNRVSIESTASLNYTMTPVTTGRLTGRLNLNGGFVRYTPPLMSEKLFRFNEGSYIAFNGDMMNPTLNVHATDVVKANVTQEGQNSRLVNFDVDLGVTGTLENMNVAFDLSTNDDITVANELQSMSPEQRANQAMNLLIYNVYTGPGTKGNASLGGNPLFSFLESQLNSWAANTIKGVDISFGIDQYDKTVDGSTSSTMSYSYQVSKSLFNDRFKIIVGGNYSTDANTDENFSQNLISDISLEYFLNNARSMYVRLFRHTGYESILEGEVTQTGVGFVYRRKILRLSDLFRFGRKPKNTTTTEANENSDEN